MRIRRQFIAICAFAALAVGADKNQFKPEPIESYSNAQKVSGLLMAADAYHDEARAKTAFGKAQPYKHGVLPVMLIIRNTSGKVMNLAEMKVEFQADRARSEAVPPADVPYLKPGAPPKLSGGSPIPGRVGIKRSKNPLNAQQIQDRAFAAPILPPGDEATGFFYFQALYRENGILYITGIKEAATGQELFFAEVPVNAGPK